MNEHRNKNEDNRIRTNLLLRSLQAIAGGWIANRRTEATAGNKDDVIVAALYKFVTLKSIQCQELQQNLKQFMDLHAMTGNFRVATEGFNGTVAGTRDALDAFNTKIQRLLDKFGVADKGGDLIYKESRHSQHPFNKAAVKFKKEIVTFGYVVDPPVERGEYVEPSDWNAAMEKADVVIDVRNDYEVRIGSFRGAVNPKTETFPQFAEFVNKKLKPDQTIAMFCTGGIRCEKASAFLKRKGFARVMHLRGGILQYFKDIPSERSEWKGECYVFDRRVSLAHNSLKGSYRQCFGCSAAIGEKEISSPEYIEGVCCPACFGDKGAEKLAQYRARHRHMTAGAKDNR